jgi:hypothetical protein
MPKLSQDEQAARETLFTNCYRTCRVIRDIFAYVDGESVALESFGTRHIAYQVINLIKTGEFVDEARRWREIFASDWQFLVDNNRVVLAVDEPQSRSIPELVRTYDTTNTMIRALENRLISVLIQSRQLAAH